MLVDKLHELLARALLYFFGPRRLIAPISTFTGQRFDPLARNEWELVQDIELADIAQGLSNICRFNGQVSHFHSVAAHSVLVCDMVEGKRNKIFALLRDSSEYVLGDVISPLKRLFPVYGWIERRVMKAILLRFGVQVDKELLATIKRADRVVMATEKRDLMPATAEEWSYLKGVPTLPEKIVPLLPHEARELFLQRFAEVRAMPDD